MQPEDNTRPKFSQIYIYDQQNELNNQLQSFEDLDRQVLKDLQEMIKEVNPFAQKYVQAGNIIQETPAFDVKLVLKTTGATVDPQRYNFPTQTDVALIIPPDNQLDISERDIVVYKSASHHPDGKSLMRIKTSHPMYDPLMYVLMLPHGDKGWEINYTTGNKKYTAMQYYKYRLMIHAGNVFNPIHRMGRLFQQYIVDMYAKIQEQ